MSTCPICLGRFGGTADIRDGMNGIRAKCEICGDLSLSESAYDDFLDPQSGQGSRLTDPDRARLAHRIRTGGSATRLIKIEADFVEHFIADGCPGPNPAQQATNIIRVIGEIVNNSGKKIPHLPIYFFAEIGAPGVSFAGDLLIELINRGLVDGIESRAISSHPTAINLGLTLLGWQAFEEEKAGQTNGKHGFLALKFGDDTLDPLVKDHLKPAVRDQLGFEIVDMRDIAQAGVIDNIMRAQIRDSRFVVVDLTHDNSGAYWEAGYAEGLGKPVIYICERSKFNDAKTHFDTNHCTTVIWSPDDPSNFCKELIATIRRSLNLFAE